MTILRFSLRVCGSQALADQCGVLRGGSVVMGGGLIKSPVASALYSTHQKPMQQDWNSSNWTRRYTGGAMGGANQFGRHVRRLLNLISYLVVTWLLDSLSGQ